MAAETILILGESGRGKEYCRLQKKFCKELLDNIGEGLTANIEIIVETKKSIIL